MAFARYTVTATAWLAMVAMNAPGEVRAAEATPEARGSTDARANAEARANAIYKDAKDKLEAGDLAEALKLATQAEGLFAHPAIVYLRGRVLRRLGRLRQADDAMRAADTALLPKPLQKPLQDERAQMAEDMRRKGELVLTTDPDTARVSVDGEDVLPEYTGWLTPGPHRVEVTAPGFKTETRSVAVVAGESTALTIRLAPVAGTLVIVVPGGLRDAEVRLDGLLVELKAGERLGDRTPPMLIQAGPHRVVCSRGDEESAHEVEVGSEGATEVRCEGIAPSTGTARKVLGWTGVAAGAGLTGWGAYGLLSFAIVDTQDPRYNDPRYTVGHQKVIVGSVLAGTGIALGVCSWLFLLRDRDDGKAKQSHARPTRPSWLDAWTLGPALPVGPNL